MINILPESGRSVVRRDYRVRLISVFFFLLALLSLLTAALFLPSYLFATVESEQAFREEARLSASKASGEKSDMEVIASTNQQITELEVYMGASRPSEALVSTLQSAGFGIELLRVSFEGVANSISLSGKAASRDSLLQFSKIVQKLPIVASVDLPVSDLAKSTDIFFSMILVLKK